MKKVDVLVVGGGTSGTIAAIQAARAGASTILVECGSQLGGTMTTGGVSFPGLFHAHGKQVIKGIGWELIEETVQLNNETLPDFSKLFGTNHPKHQVHINPYLFTLLAEEKCLEAGVNLRYYETPVRADYTGKVWIVDLVGKGTQETIQCKQLIDCTGNALLTQLAGFEVVKSEVCQPGSMMFTLSDQKLKKRTKLLIQKAFKTEEDLDQTWERLGKGFNHIHGADSTTSTNHASANIKGRMTLLKMLRILRSLPGLEKITIESICAEASIRETYRIVGMHEITKDEYLKGKCYEDALCYSFYPIDLHDEEGVKKEYLKNGVVPTIPLRSLIPKNSKNFLVAGRCICSDQMANSAIRVQASCMAMGQVAGAVASLAAQNDEAPINIPLEDIKTLLHDHGAIVPPST